MKPNCYECKYRGSVPGSAHSTCQHPANGKLSAEPLLQAFGILASVGRTAPIQADTGLNVKGHPTGVRRGWFNWPFNFDPVWLQSCDGFTSKEAK